ncbi:hypothetical protein AB1484_34940 [Parafrankia sp. FMc6]|uniref:hypothetical protein n=1 Tax=Parafrankia soli TaxID=2599596 RepID=UPI0034D78CF0
MGETDALQVVPERRSRPGAMGDRQAALVGDVGVRDRRVEIFFRVVPGERRTSERCMHPRPHLADRLVCPLRVTIGGSGLRFVGGEARPLRGMRSRPGAGGDVGGLGVLTVVESHARLDAGDPPGKQWIIDGGGVPFSERGESSGHGEISTEPGHGGQPGGELAGEENE